MHANHVCAALLLLAASTAGAQPWLSNEDCEVLAKAVRRHVWLAATEARLEPTPHDRLPVLIDGTDRRICRRTAQVTTRAFGEALAALNLPIGWEPPDPGDYCLSGDLGQCYPRINDPRVPGGQVAFVYEAWRGVRDAVASLVPAGGGGVAVFSAPGLDAALATRLDESVEAPLYARQPAR